MKEQIPGLLGMSGKIRELALQRAEKEIPEPGKPEPMDNGLYRGHEYMAYLTAELKRKERVEVAAKQIELGMRQRMEFIK